MIGLLPHPQVVAAWRSQRRTYAVLSLLIGGFAVLTAVNLGVIVILGHFGDLGACAGRSRGGHLSRIAALASGGALTNRAMLRSP
jgi:hypothetical protein